MIVSNAPKVDFDRQEENLPISHGITGLPTQTGKKSTKNSIF
jgi:hypothetical protein